MFLLASLNMHAYEISGTSGQSDRFLRLFRAIVGHDANHVAAWISIGRYWLDSADHVDVWGEEALRAFRAVTTLLPRAPDAVYGLASKGS